jgi:hypothetical protein
MPFSSDPVGKIPLKTSKIATNPDKTPKTAVSLEGNHDPKWEKFGFSENFIPNRTFREINIAPPP